jgi:hypothetical protein
MGRPAANQTRNNPMPMAWMTTVAAMIVNVARSMPQIVQASHHFGNFASVENKAPPGMANPVDRLNHDESLFGNESSWPTQELRPEWFQHGFASA